LIPEIGFAIGRFSSMAIPVTGLVGFGFYENDYKKK
jgi:hypothetical protein